jgi:putative FmdB family regulatory protein
LPQTLQQHAAYGGTPLAQYLGYMVQHSVPQRSVGGSAARRENPRPDTPGECTMPADEYHCRPCDREFAVYLSFKEHETTLVQCPHCKGTDVEQLFAPFVAVTSKKAR